MYSIAIKINVKKYRKYFLIIVVNCKLEYTGLTNLRFIKSTSSHTRLLREYQFRNVVLCPRS